MSLHAYRKDGTEVMPGDQVTDFRGDIGTFLEATRAPRPGKSGKVLVQSNVADWKHEYYETVFNLTVHDDSESAYIPVYQAGSLPDSEYGPQW